MNTFFTIKEFKHQKIVLLLIFGLLCFQSQAQLVRVIDNKGTVTEVGNNSVTTDLTAPSIPVEGDIWFDTTENISKIWDGVEWKEIDLDDIPFWRSNTNGGAYLVKNLVSYDGKIYKNLTGTNTDTVPNLDTTNWSLLESLGYKTVHHNAATDLALTNADHNLADIHIESTGTVSIASTNVSDATYFILTNTTPADSSLSFSGFTGAFVRQGGTIADIATSGLTLKANSRYEVKITDNGGAFYANITGGDLDNAKQEKFWTSDTDGGVFVANEIVNHEGDLYKNITGTNTDTTPDIDVTNWEKATPSVINNLASTSTVDALSANEGRILNNLIQALDVLPETQRNIAYLQASYSTDFIFTTADTPTPLPFDTNDEDLGITHSPITDNSEITIQSSAIYTIVAQPQVFAGSSGDFRMWLQQDTGGGWFDIPNSNVQLSLSNNGEDVIVLTTVGYFAKDTKLRIMGSVSSTNIILNAITPIGEPVVPAIILAMYANATGVNIQKEVLGIVDSASAPPTTNIDDVYVLTNIGNIGAGWGSIANLSENDAVLYDGADWIISLDVSTAFNQGEYQIYNLADNLVYYYDTTWNRLGGALSLWKSDTDGGSYGINDVINHNGTLYKNLTGANTDTVPNLDTTNWSLLESLGYKTVHHNAATDLALTNADHNLADIHIESTGTVSITSTNVSDASLFYLTNTTSADNTLSFTGFTGTYVRQGGAIVDIATTGLVVKANSRYEIKVTNNGGNFYANITGTGGDLDNVKQEKFWTSNTDGGIFVANEIVNHEGTFYRNLTGTNTDTVPNLDTTNWSLLESLGYKTVHHNAATDLALTNADHNLADIHIESSGTVSITSTNVSDATYFILTNTTSADNTLSFTGFTGAYVRQGGAIVDIATTGLVVEANSRYEIKVTNNGGNFYANITGTGGDLDNVKQEKFWTSDTNGGVFVANEVVNYDGKIYKNLTGTNTDTIPEIDSTNWIKVSVEVRTVTDIVLDGSDTPNVPTSDGDYLVLSEITSILSTPTSATLEIDGISFTANSAAVTTLDDASVISNIVDGTELTAATVDVGGVSFTADVNGVTTITVGSTTNVINGTLPTNGSLLNLSGSVWTLLDLYDDLDELVNVSGDMYNKIVDGLWIPSGGFSEAEIRTFARQENPTVEDYTDFLRNVRNKDVGDDLFFSETTGGYLNTEAHRQLLKDEFGDGTSEALETPFLRPFDFGAQYSIVNRYEVYTPDEEIKFLRLRTENNTSTGDIEIDIISALDDNKVLQRITKTITVNNYIEKDEVFSLVIDIEDDIIQPTEDYHLSFGGAVEMLYFGVWDAETRTKPRFVAIDNDNREIEFVADIDESTTSVDAWENATLGVNGTASTSATATHEGLNYTATSVGVTNFGGSINIQRGVNAVAVGTTVSFESAEFPYIGEALGGWYNNNRVLVGESLWEEETGGWSSRADIIGGIALNVGYTNTEKDYSVQEARGSRQLPDNYDFRGYSASEGDGLPSNQGWDVALENNTSYFELLTNETYDINRVSTTGQRAWNLKDTGGSNAAMLQNLTVADISTASSTDGGFAMRLFGKVNATASNNATVVLILEVQGTTSWSTGNHRIFLNFADDGVTQYVNSNPSSERYDFGNLDTYVDFLISVNSDGSADIIDNNTGVLLASFTDVLQGGVANGTRFNIASGSGGGTGENHNFVVLGGYFANTTVTPEQLTIAQADIQSTDISIEYQPNAVDRTLNFESYTNLAIGAKVTIKPNHIGSTALVRTDNAVTFNGFATWTSTTRGAEIVAIHTGDNAWNVSQGAPLERGVFIGAYDTTTQTFVAGVSQDIQFNTVGDSNAISIENDTDFVLPDGVFQVTIEPQLNRTTGSSSVSIDTWIQTDTGGGFANVSNSNIKRSAGSAGSTGIAPLTYTFRANEGDKIKFRSQSATADLVLQYTAASGDVPATPSVIINIIKVGN